MENIVYRSDIGDEATRLKEITLCLRKYRIRNQRTVRKILATSVFPFLLLLSLSFYLYNKSPYYSLLLAVPICCFYVRMFAVLHDCAHGTFFKRRWQNNALGHFIGLFFYTPFFMWREGHIKHHVNSGNLDRRQDNPDVWLMTVKEYRSSSSFRRLQYRLFRNPIIYLFVIPPLLFLVSFRLPSGKFSRSINANIILLDLLICVVYILAFTLIGMEKFLLVHLPYSLLGFMVGAFMFYLQHQFEDGYYERESEFSFQMASLKGSSFYTIHPFFEWITGDVGYHHIHHLNPGIPMYNLSSAHAEIDHLFTVRKMSLLSAIRSFGLKLWDEDGKRMVGFDDQMSFKQNV
jgi:acyl-lipid omega-6 desaturase (Delta-12 desaturase)